MTTVSTSYDSTWRSRAHAATTAYDYHYDPNTGQMVGGSSTTGPADIDRLKTPPGMPDIPWDSEDAFLSAVEGFVVGFIQAAQIAFVVAAANVLLPGAGLVALEYLVAVGGVYGGFDTGQQLYALITETDPNTGEQLSSQQWSQMLGGLVGGFAGAAVGGFFGTRVAQYVKGDRCGIFKSCLIAGTPVRTPGGSRPIEALDSGDRVLSRGEDDPDGPLVEGRVVWRTARPAPVLELHVEGRVIGTTAAHPFYAEGRGRVEAGELRAGDVLVSSAGQRLPVQGVVDTGRLKVVYNLEVAEYHTYFVGCAEWGFDVWSHNYPDEGGANTGQSGESKQTNGEAPKRSFVDSIAEHAVEEGHYPKGSEAAVKEVIENVRSSWDNMHKTQDGRTIYRKGDTILIEDVANSTGTIFQPSPKSALQYWRDFVRDNP